MISTSPVPPTSAAPNGTPVICCGLRKFELKFIACFVGFLCLVWLIITVAAGRAAGALFGQILGITIAVIVGVPIAYYVGKCLCVTALIALPSSNGQDDDTPRGDLAVYHGNKVQPEITLETTTVTHQTTHTTPSHITQYTTQLAQARITHQND